MKKLLQSEEGLQFAACIYFFTLLPLHGWLFPALLLLPDIGMLGYLVNARMGAFTYNLLHHKGLALAVLALGLYLAQPWVVFFGLLFYAHACMDRLFGFGLKYPDAFKHTHLGWMK